MKTRSVSPLVMPEALDPLVKLPNWVLWRWETTKKGKKTKVPYQAAHPNKKASSTDPKTWSDFATAKAAVGSGDGIGFCLLNSEYGAFDIDHCRDAKTGDLHLWARQLVERAASYTEVTVSGTGLRIIGRATGSKLHRKQKVKNANGVTLETYRNAERYIVMTGNALPGSPMALADVDEVMEEVVAELGNEPGRDTERKSNGHAAADEEILPDDPRLMKLGAKWIALGFKGDGIAENYGGDRSRALFAFACECFRTDIAEDVIATCLLRWKIGDHIRDSANETRTLARTLDRARQFVENSKLFEMNETYCVLPISGKTRVATWGDNPDFPGRRSIIRFSTFDDFKALLNKYRYEYVVDGKRNALPLGSWWVGNPGRRQHDGGMRFMPNRDEDIVDDTLNLWKGFSIAARKPSGKSGASGCDLLLDHGLKIICSDNAEHFDYLMKREALIAQKRTRSEIAVGLRTKEEGTGKDTWCGAFRHLYGEHAMQVQNPEHVVGKHNDHLEILLRLTADEALFAGDPRHRNALYNLITEPRLAIEPKFIGVYTAANYLNIDVISNADHFLLVGGTARRFMVPTVSPDRAGDHDYFHKIRAQLHDGGYEALLYHLLYEIDIRDFNVRDVPKTAMLLDQKLASLNIEQGWWFDTLMKGELPSGDNGPNRCQPGLLFQKYIIHAQRQGARRRSIETQLGMFLSKNVPGLAKTESKNQILYVFPSLVKCREAFATALQQDVHWGGKAEWAEEPF
jgi:hypothetical protein